MAQDEAKDEAGEGDSQQPEAPKEESQAEAPPATE